MNKLLVFVSGIIVGVLSGIILMCFLKINNFCEKEENKEYKKENIVKLKGSKIKI